MTQVVNGVSQSPFKKWMFEKAMAAKMDELKRSLSLPLSSSLPPPLMLQTLLSLSRGIIRRNSMWDYIIFKKVQNSLGGRVRFIMTGSAPISEKVLNFLRCGFGCMVSCTVHACTCTCT